MVYIVESTTLTPDTNINISRLNRATLTISSANIAVSPPSALLDIMSWAMNLHFLMRQYFPMLLPPILIYVVISRQDTAINSFEEHFQLFPLFAVSDTVLFSENDHPDTQETHSAIRCPPMMDSSSKEHSSGSQWTHAATLPDNWMSSCQWLFAGQTARIM